MYAVDRQDVRWFEEHIRYASKKCFNPQAAAKLMGHEKENRSEKKRIPEGHSVMHVPSEPAGFVRKEIAARKNRCSELRLYFFICPWYNLSDWKKDKYEV